MSTSPSSGLRHQYRLNVWPGGEEIHRAEWSLSALSALARLGSWLAEKLLHWLLSAAVIIAVILRKIGGMFSVATAQ